MITISNTVAQVTAHAVTAAAQAAGFEVTIQATSKTRAPKPSDKIVADMKNLAMAMTMTKAKSKNPISAEEAEDVHAAMIASRELFDFVEGSGAKAHVVRCVNLVLHNKITRSEFNELIKHFEETVILAAIETEQLKEVDAMEAAK